MVEIRSRYNLMSITADGTYLELNRNILYDAKKLAIQLEEKGHDYELYFTHKSGEQVQVNSETIDSEFGKLVDELSHQMSRRRYQLREQLKISPDIWDITFTI